jgi:hypothetical protein
MRYAIFALASLTLLAGCAGSTGVFPVAPGIWSVSEMRAPALGGGAEAQRVALIEADGFCRTFGLVYVPISAGPGAYPNSSYGPVSYTISFRCAPPVYPPAAPQTPPPAK